MKKLIIPHVPFYFIRHGQTDWNFKRIIQGHIDIPLNETGIEQAKKAAPFFIDKGITRIVTSPLVRAHKTATIINEYLQVPLYVHEGLKERHFGKREGTLKIESEHTHITQMVEDGESTDALKERLSHTLHKILLPHETTLIVAHNGVYWALMNLLGFENEISSNATPYLFNPPEKKRTQGWSVLPTQKL